MSQFRRLKNIPTGELVKFGSNVYTIEKQEKAHTVLIHQGIVGKAFSATYEKRTESNQLMVEHMLKRNNK